MNKILAFGTGLLIGSAATFGFNQYMNYKTQKSYIEGLHRIEEISSSLEQTLEENSGKNVLYRFKESPLELFEKDLSALQKTIDEEKSKYLD